MCIARCFGTLCRVGEKIGTMEKFIHILRMLFGYKSCDYINFYMINIRSKILKEDAYENFADSWKYTRNIYTFECSKCYAFLPGR